MLLYDFPINEEDLEKHDIGIPPENFKNRYLDLFTKLLLNTYNGLGLCYKD